MSSTEDILKYGVMAYAAYYIYTKFIASPAATTALPPTTSGVIVPPTSTMPSVTTPPIVSTDPNTALASNAGFAKCGSYGGQWSPNTNQCAITSLFTGTASASSLLGKLMGASGADSNTLMTAAQWSSIMSRVVGQTINASGTGYKLWPSYLPGADSSIGMTAAQYIQAYVSAGLPIPTGVSLSGFRQTRLM